VARFTLSAVLLIGVVPFAWAGAWGVGSFENDDALDWVSELQRASGPQLLVSTLQRVDEKSKYIEAPDCSVALAAAEVVAAARGKPAASLPAEVTSWIARVQPNVDARLLEAARSAVTNCRDGKNSELRDLWLEGDGKAWLNDSARLLARLK
jgi:Domain of unknown function (DUF4259)